MSDLDVSEFYLTLNEVFHEAKIAMSKHDSADIEDNIGNSPYASLHDMLFLNTEAGNRLSSDVLQKAFQIIKLIEDDGPMFEILTEAYKAQLAL